MLPYTRNSNVFRTVRYLGDFFPYGLLPPKEEASWSFGFRPSHDSTATEPVIFCAGLGSRLCKVELPGFKRKHPRNRCVDASW